MNHLAKPSPRIARAKHLAPTNVATLLRELQNNAHADRGISIALDVEEALHVAVDPAQLMATMTGLLSEAIATSPCGAHIVLRCSSEPDGVVIEVEQATEARPDRELETKAAITVPAWTEC